jgi:3' terminal RNA ribose 2'-O-methyltransferase Hen1
MLLTITLTTPPATDLGYLLHKNPARVQRFDLPFGHSTVFYPVATEQCCTVALLGHVDPIGLIRGKRGAEAAFALEQYVNDRPYAASSLLSVAIARVFGTALSGRCEERPDLVEQALPLQACLAAVPARGGAVVLRELFEPLGYQVEARRHALDADFPEWGDSPYFELRLDGCVRLRDLLAHLYVLIPVLDGAKHYWVGEAEVEKLLRHGAGWLESHPQKESITRSYLRRQRGLVDDALSRLVESNDTTTVNADTDADTDTNEDEVAVEAPLRLHDIRLRHVVDLLRAAGARRVLDLGCGDGKLLRLLLREPAFAEIVGVDVSHRALDFARRRLHWERMSDIERTRIQLLHGSLTYRDRRLEGYDAAALVEVIEHLDPPRLRALERSLFHAAQPATIIITTPNRDYNVLFDSLPAGDLRHADHRFEWSRHEFGQWASRVAGDSGYGVRFEGIGPQHDEHGSPTQVGIFQR